MKPSLKIQYKVFQKELYNGIPNVTMQAVLPKRLNLKAYKVSIVQGSRDITE
jgi:hypothetical protein